MNTIRTMVAIAVLSGTAFAQSNLLVNGDAETGTLAGWTDPLGNGFLVSATTMHSGAFAFHPGLTGPVGPLSNELRQDVDVTALAAEIDAGLITSLFRGCGRSNAASGFVDAGRVLLEWRNAVGTVLASFDTGTFSPFNAWQTFADVGLVPAGTRTLRVRLLGNRQIGASTDCYFDDLELGLYQWQTTGSGCAGGAGVPAMQLDSPPWLGETFALSATNLAGGIAVMVTGFGSVNVNMQPLGLGFGAGCTLLVSPDGLEVVPQIAGTATWSLPLPSNPALVGFDLWNQVAELSVVSAISDAGHAVLR